LSELEESYRDEKYQRGVAKAPSQPSRGVDTHRMLSKNITGSTSFI